jgi:hypothetical protein
MIKIEKGVMARRRGRRDGSEAFWIAYSDNGITK